MSVLIQPNKKRYEDIGERLEFEIPYWSGQHDVEDDDFPFPFHPLDLGEEVLKHFLG